MPKRKRWGLDRPSVCVDQTRQNPLGQLPDFWGKRDYLGKAGSQDFAQNFPIWGHFLGKWGFCPKSRHAVGWFSEESATVIRCSGAPYPLLVD